MTAMTDTEREADAQAALSRLANHRSQPGDYLKIPYEESGLVRFGISHTGEPEA
jgi:hypothetical protein